ETVFLKALLDREAQVSTGLINGIAIPHGIDDSIITNAALMIRLSKEIDYPTLDDSKVKYVFALAINANSSHLNTLMDLSTILLEEKTMDGLVKAKSKEDIERLFE
ncbi:MAG: PTS sugar transporter subunit IIA, partial [Bacilli bacterium]